MKEILKGFYKLKGYFIIAVMCHELMKSTKVEILN